jgi:hypothetical protein
MSKNKQMYKTIRTVAVVVMMLLQGGDVPTGDGPRGQQYGPVRPSERLICQPEVIPQQR